MVETMLIGVMPEPGKVEIREVPRPIPGPDDALVRLKACAICTWEQRAYKGIQKVQFPFAGGHEVSGEIVQMGSDGRGGLHVGDHVGLGPANYCGQCYNCRRGFTARCLSPFPRVSVEGLWGPMGFAEYRVVRADRLYKMAIDLPFVQAALLEPLSCAVHSSRKLEPVLGEDVVVIGAGAMGLLNVLVLKLLGARVIACDLSPTRCSKALSVGADVAINPSEQDAIAVVKQLTEGRGADAVVTAVGGAKVNEMALSMISSTGRVVLFASAHPAAPIPLDPNTVHKQEQHVLGTEGVNPRDLQTGALLLSKRLLDVSPLIEATFPLLKLQEALELAVDPFSYRVVIQP